MADIRRYPFVSHLRSTETGWVRHSAGGRQRHVGTSSAFWFRPMSAVVSEVPVDDREIPLLVHAWTSDRQDVAVQGTVTFRFADPAAASSRIDFSVDTGTGSWRARPLELVASLLTELAQQHAVTAVAARSLEQTLVDGIDAVRTRIAHGLASEGRLEGTGIAVLGVRVVSLSLEKDVERALKTPERERIQGEADRAGYARRAQAVDQERAIAENELANQVELATREEELVVRRGSTERRRAQEQAAAARVVAEAGAERSGIESLAAAERTRVEADARADATRAVGVATAETERASYETLATAGPDLLRALALRDLAEAVAGIDNLTVTPDLLTGLLARMADGPATGRPA